MLKFTQKCVRSHGIVGLRRNIVSEKRGYVFLNQQILFLSDFKNDKQNVESGRVYYGLLTPQIKAVKVFSLLTSLGGLVAQPLLVKQAAALGGMPIVIAVCGFIGFFTFVTPFLLHIITKRYVTTIEYDKNLDVYKATTYTFFLRKKQIVFKSGEVKVPDVPGMFTSFMVKKTPLFVDPRLFENPEHYAKIMGYDKPMDFKLNLDHGEDDKK